MRRFLPVALVLAFFATTGMTCSQDNAGLGVMTACSSATSGLKMLTAMKAQGKLSPINIARVDMAVNAIDPICGSATIPDPQMALTTLETQLLILNGVIVNPAGVN